MMRKPSCLISCSHWLPEGSLSVLVGRHGGTKPVGRTRIYMRPVINGGGLLAQAGGLSEEGFVEARNVAIRAGLPTVRIIAARKIEWPRQRRLVPAHAPASALHYAQRHRIRARREGV